MRAWPTSDLWGRMVRARQEANELQREVQTLRAKCFQDRADALIEAAEACEGTAAARVGLAAFDLTQLAKHFRAKAKGGE